MLETTAIGDGVGSGDQPGTTYRVAYVKMDSGDLACTGMRQRTSYTNYALRPRQRTFYGQH